MDDVKGLCERAELLAQDAYDSAHIKQGDFLSSIATALTSLSRELAEARAERDEADAEIVSTESLLAEERRMRFAAEAASASKDERIRELTNEVGILLANIRQIEEATGEGPEGEDALIVDQIERDHRARSTKEPTT